MSVSGAGAHVTTFPASRTLDAVDEVRGAYYRLVLLVGPEGVGKTTALQGIATELGWPIFRVGECMAEVLLDRAVRSRAVAAPGILGDLLRDTDAAGVCLDNIELLFEISLALDPLRLLQGLARDRTIIAAWPGTFVGNVLGYAADGHPEARRYSRPEAAIITDPRKGVQ